MKFGLFVMPCHDHRGNPTLAFEQDLKLIEFAESIGATLQVNLTRAAPNSGAMLMVGASNTTWNGTPLPFSLKVMGGGNCLLLVSMDVLVGLNTNTLGNVSFSARIGNAKALLGAKAYLQFAINDEKANSMQWVTTNGAAIVIGN